jgi:hypothetical protein
MRTACCLLSAGGLLLAALVIGNPCLPPRSRAAGKVVAPSGPAVAPAPPTEPDPQPQPQPQPPPQRQRQQPAVLATKPGAGQRAATVDTAVWRTRGPWRDAADPWLQPAGVSALLPELWGDVWLPTAIAPAAAAVELRPPQPRHGTN